MCGLQVSHLSMQSAPGQVNLAWPSLREPTQ